MKLIGFFFVVLMLAAGCATQPTVHGVPNFGVVVAARGTAREIDRGGEPTAEGWHYLASRGITNVVKLNTDSEGSDDQALALGMTVQKFPITLWQQIFGDGLDRQIAHSVAAIKPGTYIHCSHGKNRTGTVIGVYRREHQWNKAQAQVEMDKYGWEDSLPGLKWWWSTFLKP